MIDTSSPAGLLDVACSRGTAHALRVTTAGNVGIGTTSPSFALTVQSATQFQGLAVKNASNNVALLDGTTAANDAGQLALYNGGTLTSLISSSGNSYIQGGNVGIGTTSPNGPFDVLSSATGGLRANNATLYVSRTTNSTQLQSINFRNGSVRDFLIGRPANTDDLTFGADNGISFGLNPKSSSMRRALRATS